MERSRRQSRTEIEINVLYKANYANYRNYGIILEITSQVTYNDPPATGSADSSGEKEQKNMKQREQNMKQREQKHF